MPNNKGKFCRKFTFYQTGSCNIRTLVCQSGEKYLVFLNPPRHDISGGRPHIPVILIHHVGNSFTVLLSAPGMMLTTEMMGYDQRLNIIHLYSKPQLVIVPQPCVRGKMKILMFLRWISDGYSGRLRRETMGFCHTAVAGHFNNTQI